MCESNIKKTLSDILLDISLGNLSKKYFNESRSWLFNKLDSEDDDLSDSEKTILKESLFDLAKRINTCAKNIK